MTAKPKPVADFFRKAKTSARKKLRLGHSLDELDPDLAAKELFFKGPPLTPELIAAIKLISPQFHLAPDEASRRFWELNQNGLCWGEFEVLAPFLKTLTSPQRVLDIGPGLGRSAVFFKKAMDWNQVPFHLYEGAGESTRYTKAGPRFTDSFCGTPEALEGVLKHNGIEEVKIFDAAAIEARLDRMPGPYDFIYSFFAVGFHWSLEHFLEEILGLMHERSIGAFTLHDRFERFEKLDSVPYKVLKFRKSWPRDRWSRLLVLSRDEELLKAVGTHED
jgi:hypothetical protein